QLARLPDARFEARGDARANGRRIAVGGLQLRRQPRDLLAQRPDVARVAERGPRHAPAQSWPNLAVQHAYESALARAVVTRNEPVAPLVEMPVDRVQHLPAAEPNIGALDEHERRAVRRRSGCGWRAAL